jgi:hypothetical protein
MSIAQVGDLGLGSVVGNDRRIARVSDGQPVEGVATSGGEVGYAVVLGVSKDEDGVAELAVAADGEDGAGILVELSLDRFEREVVRLTLDFGGAESSNRRQR